MMIRNLLLASAALAMPIVASAFPWHHHRPAPHWWHHGYWNNHNWDNRDYYNRDYCDYSDAWMYEGWGWNAYRGESCPPR